MARRKRRDSGPARLAARLAAVLEELQEVIDEMRGAAEAGAGPAPEPRHDDGGEEEEGTET